MNNFYRIRNRHKDSACLTESEMRELMNSFERMKGKSFKPRGKDESIDECAIRWEQFFLNPEFVNFALHYHQVWIVCSGINRDREPTFVWTKLSDEEYQSIKHLDYKTLVFGGITIDKVVEADKYMPKYET